MSPEENRSIEQFVHDHHGQPTQLNGTQVIVMSTRVFRQCMGVETQQELEDSLAAIQRGIGDFQNGRSRPFRDALEDLGRQYKG